jgi:hypothetical protein
MHRQKYDSRKPQTSQESLLNRRAGGLYCRKCRQPVKRRHALHAGSKRSRCPVCGELLELRTEDGPTTNGESPPPKD